MSKDEYEITHEVPGTPFTIRHVDGGSTPNEKQIEPKEIDETPYEITHEVPGTPFTIRHVTGDPRNEMNPVEEEKGPRRR